MHRTAAPFALLDRSDPRDVPQTNLHILGTPRKFFEAHKVTRRVHSNSLFEVSDAHFVCEWVSKRKNHPQLAFAAIKWIHAPYNHPVCFVRQVWS